MLNFTASADSLRPGLNMYSEAFATQSDCDLSSELHEAVRGNSMSKVTKALEKNININVQDARQRTGLLLACSSDCQDVAIVTELLRRGADVHVADMLGCTPLYAACEHGCIAVVDMLLSYGALVHYTNSPRSALKSPLHVAVQNRNVAVVRRLLAHWSCDVDYMWRDCTSLMALCGAAQWSPVEQELLEALLAHGADVNAESGRAPLTALFYACKANHSWVAAQLLAHGADVNKSELFPPLHIAIRLDHVAMAQLLLLHGADVNLRARCGRDSLTLALEHSEQLAALLLPLVHHVPQADAQDGEMTPLRAAVLNSRVDCIEQLLRAGCLVTRQVLRDAVYTRRLSVFSLVWRHVDAAVVSASRELMRDVFTMWDNMLRCCELYACLLGRRDVVLNMEYAVQDLVASLYVSGHHNAFLEPRVRAIVAEVLRLAAAYGGQMVHIMAFMNWSEHWCEAIATLIMERTVLAVRQGDGLFRMLLSIGYVRPLLANCVYVHAELLYRYLPSLPRVEVLDYLLGVYSMVEHRSRKRLVLLMEACGPAYYGRWIDLLRRPPTAKSLQELARDALKRQLNETCGDNQQYHAMISELPEPIQDILRCQTPLNFYEDGTR